MTILNCSSMCSLISGKYDLLVCYHLNDDKDKVLKGNPGECRFCKKHSPYVTFNKIMNVMLVISCLVNMKVTSLGS